MKITDVGRVLWAGFDGPAVDEHVRELLKLGAGGFILYARNIESPAQTRELIAEIRAFASDRRLLFSVDQEGGRVARLRAPCTVWPAMRALGNTGDAQLAREFGEAVGRELRAIGFDIDFAPVVDVDTNPANPVIGDRSFGREAQLVSRLGGAVIAGLQDAGVWACAKHFPGHGDTDTDSHTALPVVAHERRRLNETELPPFRAAIEAGVAATMTAHIVVTNIDADVPATMSPRVLSILRDELRFEGVIVSDDLEMKAVSANFALGEAATAAARAGVDALLVCRQLGAQEEVVRALFDAHRSGKLPPLRLSDMQRRIERTADRFPPPQPGDLSVLGCDRHLRLAEEIARRGA